MRTHLVAAIAAATVSLTMSAHAANLTGAGGTAIYPVLPNGPTPTPRKTGDTVNYQAIGSGGGIQQIEAEDGRLRQYRQAADARRRRQEQSGAVPAVIISIMPVVHLPGIKPGELVLDGPTLADIFLGKITDWDDPAIKKLNPNVKLPHHGDPDRASLGRVGHHLQLHQLSRQGQPGMEEQGRRRHRRRLAERRRRQRQCRRRLHVQQINGSIGYVEYAYAMENNMVYTNMINRRASADPTMEAFQAAAANADFSKVQDFYVILTNQPGDKSWPITAATYMLLRNDIPPIRTSRC